RGADPEHQIAAVLVLAEAVPHDLPVAHRPPVPLQVIDDAVDSDFGVWADDRIEDMRSAEDLFGVQPEAQLRELHLVEQVIDFRRPAAVDVFRPSGLLTDGPDQPEAFAAQEAVEP